MDAYRMGAGVNRWQPVPLDYRQRQQGALSRRALLGNRRHDRRESGTLANLVRG